MREYNLKNEGYNQNVIEWIRGENIAYLTLSQKSLINKVLKLSKSRDDIKIVSENEDGTLYARIPSSWIKISPPKEVSEDRREKMSKHMKEVANRRWANNV